MAKTIRKPNPSRTGKPPEEMEVTVFFEIDDMPLSEEELDVLERFFGTLIDEMLKQ